MFGMQYCAFSLVHLIHNDEICIQTYILQIPIFAYQYAIITLGTRERDEFIVHVSNT